MNFITVDAYAKINLFLEVCARLDNGYHDLESVMQSIDLKDTVTITRTDTERITVSTSFDELADDESNLVYKAATAFLNAYEVKHNGLHFEVEKNIPMGAGLAGGSADAAASLIGLNRLFELNISEDELCKLGKNIGADVPFCIKKGTCLARGIGEKLDRITPLEQYYVVVSLGEDRISTKWAFEQIDSLTDRSIKKADDMIAAIEKGSIKDISDRMYNIFEEVSPHKQRIKDILTKFSGNKSLMSGSGPSIFSLFENETDARLAEEALRAEKYEAYMCRVLKID